MDKEQNWNLKLVMETVEKHLGSCCKTLQRPRGWRLQESKKGMKVGPNRENQVEVQEAALPTSPPLLCTDRQVPLRLNKRLKASCLEKAAQNQRVFGLDPKPS